MMLNLIMHSDVDNKNVQDVLCFEMSRNPKHLFLTSTIVLKTIRKRTVCKQSEDKLFSFTEFEKLLTHIIFKNKDCLSNTEQRYILSLVIKEMYANDESGYNAINAIQKELYELFSNLQFSRKKVTVETVKAIASDYSIAESTLFELYRRYLQIIEDIIDISNGKVPSNETTRIIESLLISKRQLKHA